jgi:hypothetical protein
VPCPCLTGVPQQCNQCNRCCTDRPGLAQGIRTRESCRSKQDLAEARRLALTREPMHAQNCFCYRQLLHVACAYANGTDVGRDPFLCNHEAVWRW